MRLVAVSKARSAAEISEALEAGCRDFGENYFQEALPKIAALAGRGVTWHFIGALQSNKAREVARHFDWVHGIDREKVAQALSRHRGTEGSELQACIQVNVSREATKSGVEPSQALALAHAVAALPGLRLRGLMGIASPSGDRATQRREFALLRTTLLELRAAGLAVDTLSMGMSEDLESAIAEGSTLVRVGSAIFGPRVQSSTVA